MVRKFVARGPRFLHALSAIWLLIRRGLAGDWDGWSAPAFRFAFLFAPVAWLVATGGAAEVCADRPWRELFDGHSLDGWRASGPGAGWCVERGCLVARSRRGPLFYQGPIGGHDFRNFELEVEVRTESGCNSGILFHTVFAENGRPAKGYEVQIANACDRDSHTGGEPSSDAVSATRWKRAAWGDVAIGELARTGSLLGVRNIYSVCVRDGAWFHMRIRVVGRRIGVWVNDDPTVDYVEPEHPYRGTEPSGRVLGHGTIALAPDAAGRRVAFRRVAIRLLPDDADTHDWRRASDQGYGLAETTMDRMGAKSIPVIDFHVHLRGGMTIEKALARQAVTGVNVGVLRNIGKGWPIETDDQLEAFLDSVAGRPVFVGVQVNDRDWMHRHSAALLDRLDYVLGDTMIMPMPDDDSPPVKLWQADRYSIDDAEAWMERYVRHNLRVLAEPITILANPTYLPPAVKDRYDELWTDQRMRRIIRAAIDNHVALEINARSGLPHDRFIRMAKRMGARFTFGTNNFDDRPIDMSRCFEAIRRYGLTAADLYIPPPK